MLGLKVSNYVTIKSF